jgi:hypothetical protein
MKNHEKIMQEQQKAIAALRAGKNELEKDFLEFKIKIIGLQIDLILGKITNQELNLKLLEQIMSISTPEQIQSLDLKTVKAVNDGLSKELSFRQSIEDEILQGEDFEFLFQAYLKNPAATSLTKN